MTNSLAKYFDHTLLKPNVTYCEMNQLIEEALKHQFASVCINPDWVNYCAEKLSDSNVKVCTVVGFPLGASTTAVKKYETKNAVKNGATEVDMVINISALKNNEDEKVKTDIMAVVEEANKSDVLTKVILETCLLTDSEIIKACKLAEEAGAQFVKTSTGFGAAGATIEHVKLMRKTVGPTIGVKASGGIKTREHALQMIEAGANRIGASSSVAIVER